MNNGRRKQLEQLGQDLDRIKNEIDGKYAEEEIGEAGDREELASLEENWVSRVDDIRTELETLKDEEQEYYDNMPEGLQGGERGTQAEEAVGYMEEAINHMEELVDVTEVGEFVKLFHEKYDDINSQLSDAAA